MVKVSLTFRSADPNGEPVTFEIDVDVVKIAELKTIIRTQFEYKEDEQILLSGNDGANDFPDDDEITIREAVSEIEKSGTIIVFRFVSFLLDYSHAQRITD